MLHLSSHNKYHKIYHCWLTQQQKLKASLEKQDAHLHKSKGERRNKIEIREGYGNNCEHETLNCGYDTGNRRDMKG